MPNSNQETPGLPATKCCSTCKESFPLDQFFYQDLKRGTRKKQCRACCYETSLANPWSRMLKSAKKRANYKGLAFDLDLEFIKSIDRDRCPYLEISIFWPDGSIKRARPNSKSLDRIDSTKGYTKDNVIICSWRANELLKDGSLPELSLLVHNFRRILNSTKPTNEN